MQLSNLVVPTKISSTPVFHACVAHVFEKFDSNKDGAMDCNELTVAMCHLHYNLARHCPGLTQPPTSDAITDLLRKHDKDSSATLSQQEFSDMAVTWFDQHGTQFIQQMVFSSLLSMVVIPGAATLARERIPLGKRIPSVLFKILFGVALKLVATNISMAAKPKE